MHPPLSRVTRDEFLAELARRGHQRTQRWHEDWIDAGLIDRGEPEGRAGGGSQYTWPYVQIEHAHALLCKVDEGAALGVLANYVVWTWLWYGDEWIAYRQVPKAMRTWHDAESHAPVNNIRSTARQLVDKVAHPSGAGKRRLVRALVDFPPNGDAETLRDPFDEVFDPDRTGEPRGPAGAAMTTDSYLRLISARQGAIAKLGDYTEAQYRAAREMCIQTRGDYAREQPKYAADPTLGALYEPVDVNELFNSACQDLLTCLALLYEAPDNRHAGGLPTS